MSRRPDRSAPRRPRRARPNRRRKNRLPLLFGLLCVGLIVEAGYAGLTSPRFAVRTIEVEGTRKVSKADVLAAAAIPPGQNLFRLRAEKSVKRVAQIPRVLSVSLRRRLPNRVILQVEERRPVALLAAGTSYTMVDDTGIPYARFDMPGLKLPVLRLDPAPAFSLGRPLADPAFVAGMKALPSFHGLFTRGGALQVDRQRNFCFNGDDFTVRLGQPDNLNYKVKLLRGLLAGQPQLLRKAQYVDLSAPEHPAYMPLGAVTASVSGAPSASPHATPSSAPP